MTKDELAAEVQSSLLFTPYNNLGKADLRTIIEHTIKAIQAAVTAGDAVTLRGFGTFKTVERKAKQARNITKGTTISIPARKRVTFKPAIEFRTIKD